MSMGKKRNPLNLSLPPTVAEEFSGTGNAADGDASAVSTEPTIDEQLQSLVLSQPQIERMQEWQTLKRQLGELREEQLERICELGHGNGGIVHKMRHREVGLIMARKLVHLEVKPSVRQQIIKELEVLHKCNSPYIVGFYGAFTDNNDISICMEYMDGLSLDILLKKNGPIAERRIGRIAVAVLKGLTYLKEEFHILHRDIKPSNILVNSRGEIKLCDFGVSCMLIDSMANSFVGTRSYMAPERLTGARYSIQSDVWSLGLSLVELSIGRFPIPAPSRREIARIFNVPVDDVQLQYDDCDATAATGDGSAPRMLAIFELLECIVNKNPPLLPLNLFSENYVDFVGRCLARNVLDRADLKALLREPFFREYDVPGGDADFAAWVRSIPGAVVA